MNDLNTECENSYCECDRKLVLEMDNATNFLGSCPKDPGCSKLDAWKNKS